MKHLSLNALRNLRRPDLLVNRAFVGGAWISGEGSFEVVDPATGESIATVASCGLGAVGSAVEAAAMAFHDWRNQLPLERGNVLRAWGGLVRAHVDDLATIMVAEQGKPLSEARAEVAYAASFLDWFASEAERTYGETIPSHKRDSRLAVTMQPVGVAVAVTPWNFPSAMITRKAAAALAAGCTIIIKPASDTPLSALALARLAEEAGVPAGVFQVVTGAGSALSERLLAEPLVRAFSFTGSTEVGRLLLERAARTVKKVSMELGGHAPFIVFRDAPVAEAVRGCIAAKFSTSGQDCLAANRIYVEEDIYDVFISAFVEAVRCLRVGHGLTEGIDIGPMTRASVAHKCRAHIRDAVTNGARLLVGGEYSPLGANFVLPTVLADVTDQMRIAQEETFGPVAAVIPFRAEADVIARANATEMGLAAYVYTRDLSRAMRVSDRLEYGMVGVNTAHFTGAPIPFGGWKQSGLGREGSRHGMLEYMEMKYVCIGGLGA
jgi:succinate-semialdehyde dehydrogenase/glutarate-semialdehyde dehydrogenase/aspartate-semialdehyde dehydrogenase